MAGVWLTAQHVSLERFWPGLEQSGSSCCWKMGEDGLGRRRWRGISRQSLLR